MRRVGDVRSTGVSAPTTSHDGLLGSRPATRSSEADAALAVLEARLFGAATEHPTLGRYRLVQRIAAGAFGTVWRASDPELDRAVAIKVIAARDSGSRDRLLTEARALARVNHPNVVAVFDSGRCDVPRLAGDGPGTPGIYLVMELVQGPTLAQWLARGGQSLAQTIAMFVAIGRGLASAHAAGLVHRDVKPANAIVGDDGRVRVVDFGLALDLYATTEDAVAGTPRYMAPEQVAGDPVDGRADQYAVCVALAHALSGRPPFDADSATALTRRKLEQAPDLDRETLPRWLVRVLERGLAPRPEDRFATMDDLVSALQRGLGRRRRLIAGGIAIATVVGVGGAAWSLASRADAACPDSAERLRGVWGEPQRVALVDAFLGDERAWSEQGARGTAAALDAYATRWADEHRAACTATRIDRTATEADLGRRTLCLERALARLEAVAASLAAPAPTPRESATESLRLLPDPAACREAAADPVASDRAAVVRALELERTLASLELLASAPETSAEVEALAPEVDALDSPALDVALARVRSVVHRGAARFDLAIAELEKGLYAAEAAGDQELATRMLATLVLVSAAEARRLDDAERYSRLAEAKQQATPLSASTRFELAWAEGVLLQLQGDWNSAGQSFERALVLAKEAFGAEHPRVGDIHAALGAVLTARGEGDAALIEHARALEIVESHVGRHHPRFAATNMNLAMAKLALGRAHEAIGLLDESLAVYVAAYGDEHPRIAMVRINRGAVLAELGEYAAAATEFDEALSIRSAKLAPDSLHVATARGNLGAMQLELGQLDLAIANQRSSLATRIAVLGPTHLETASARTNLGAALVEQGDRAAAAEELDRAVADAARIGPAGDRIRAEALYWLGRARLPDDRVAAVAAIEQAFALAGNVGTIPIVEADAAAALARVLVDEDPRRAFGLAALAGAIYVGRGGTQSRTAALTAWVAAAAKSSAIATALPIAPR